MYRIDPIATRTIFKDEFCNRERKRTWRQTEKKSTTQLDDRFFDQIIIAPDLSIVKAKTKGTQIPDHIAAFDSNGLSINLEQVENLRSVSHFEVLEDKNYQIEFEKGRKNLIANLVKQINERNALLTSFGASVHQTIIIDISGHGAITIEEMEDLLDSLVDVLPDNVDIEPLIK